MEMTMGMDGLKEIRVQPTEAEREFRELFKRLRKKYHLRMHLHSSVYEKKDDLIEIWREEDGKIVETVCRVKEKDIEDCYSRAVIDLEHYEKRMQEKEARRRMW